MKSSTIIVELSVSPSKSVKLLFHLFWQVPRCIMFKIVISSWQIESLIIVKYPFLSFSSVQSVMSDSLWPHGLQYTRPSFPSPTPRVYSNSCPLSQWCHPAISSSVPVSSCLQSFPGSGSLPASWLFSSGGQSIGASASASVLPMNIQGWFSLGLTSLISMLSKGLSRVISNTTVQKHQFFTTQPSLWSNTHTCIWLLENP